MPITWQGWMRYLNGGAIFNPDKGRQTAGPDRISTSSGVTVTDDRAISIGAVFRSIRILAEVAALLPLRGYERLDNGDRKELPPTHYLPKLLRRPNSAMSGGNLCEAMYAQAAGWGNAYSQIVRQSAGIPIEVWPYKVDRMQVDRREDMTVEYKYPNPAGSLKVLDDNRVMHMRAFTVDGVMGISAMAAARSAMGLALQAENYAGSFYASGGRPSGIMTSDRVLQPQQRAQIEEQYGSMADGTTGKRFWLLEGSLKYEALTVNPEDMQMLQTRAFQVAEIARFFGVPLFLLMETEKSTSWGSGMEQQMLAFLTLTLMPYLSDMQDSWNLQVIPEKDQASLFVEADVLPLLAADYTSQALFYASMAQNALMTRNELRRRLKLPRVENDNADALTAQVNLVPIEKLGEDAPPKDQQPVPSNQLLKAMKDELQPVFINVAERMQSAVRDERQVLQLDHVRHQGEVERQVDELERDVEKALEKIPSMLPQPVVGHEYERDDKGRMSAIVLRTRDGATIRRKINRDTEGRVAGLTEE